MDSQFEVWTRRVELAELRRNYELHSDAPPGLRGVDILHFSAAVKI